METPKTRWRVIDRAEQLAAIELELHRMAQIERRPPSEERATHTLLQAMVLGRLVYEALQTQQAE